MRFRYSLLEIAAIEFEVAIDGEFDQREGERIARFWGLNLSKTLGEMTTEVWGGRLNGQQLNTR